MKFKILTGLLTGLVVSGSTTVLFCQSSRAGNNSLFSNGTLKYINTGILNAEPGVCAAVNKDDYCTNRTLLFTLKPRSDADASLKKLPKFDLTVVPFTNSQNYSVAKIGNSDLAAGEKAEDFLIQGEEKYRKGDRQGAIEAFSQAIELNPNYVEAYYNRGRVRYVLGDHKGAIADYNEALRINPSDSKAYYNRGVTRSRLGDNKGAIADFNEALRINPKYAKAYNVRGYVRAELGDKQGAIQDFQKAADLFQKQGDRDNYNRAINNLNKLQ